MFYMFQNILLIRNQFQLILETRYGKIIFYKLTLSFPPGKRGPTFFFEP